MNPQLMLANLASPGAARAAAELAPVAAAQLSVALCALAMSLARHRGGRVMLHCCAMVGDRQVRFHCAGIAREFFRS